MPLVEWVRGKDVSPQLHGFHSVHCVFQLMGPNSKGICRGKWDQQAEEGSVWQQLLFPVWL